MNSRLLKVVRFGKAPTPLNNSLEELVLAENNSSFYFEGKNIRNDKTNYVIKVSYSKKSKSIPLDAQRFYKVNFDNLFIPNNQFDTKKEVLEFIKLNMIKGGFRVPKDEEKNLEKEDLNLLEGLNYFKEDSDFYRLYIIYIPKKIPIVILATESFMESTFENSTLDYATVNQNGYSSTFLKTPKYIVVTKSNGEDSWNDYSDSITDDKTALVKYVKELKKELKEDFDDHADVRGIEIIKESDLPNLDIYEYIDPEEDIEVKFWKLVARMNWGEDENSDRITEEYKNDEYGEFSEKDRQEFLAFFRQLHTALAKKVDSINPEGVYYGRDDWFSDAISSIIGMGEETYTACLGNPKLFMENYNKAAAESFTYVWLN